MGDALLGGQVWDKIVHKNAKDFAFPCLSVTKIEFFTSSKNSVSLALGTKRWKPKKCTARKKPEVKGWLMPRLYTQIQLADIVR